jgi:hypothetical protein
MDDTDVMTFGKYRDTPIGEVPASYLLWLWGNGMHREQKGFRDDPVRTYIMDNFHALETECPDMIIKHHPFK